MEGSGSGSGSGYRYVGGERSRVEIVSGKWAPRLQKADRRPTAARSPKPHVLSMTMMRVSGSSQTQSHESAQSEYNNNSNNYNNQSNSKAGRSFKDNKDPAEKKRKKRIAKYKVYTVEGKLKASLNKGLHWIKNKCSQIVRRY